MTQPEALRLADQLEGYECDWVDRIKSAAELRRLHDENEMMAAAYQSACAELKKLEQQNKALLEALEQALPQLIGTAYQNARAAIKAAEEEA